MAGTYPIRHDIVPWMIPTAVSGSWTRHQRTDTFNLGRIYNSTNSIGDEVSWDLLFQAGTWDCTMIYRQDIDIGTWQAQMDGTSLGTVDGYGSGVNNQVSTISGFTVSTSGLYTFSLEITGKNASASDYYLSLNHVTLIRTGA